MGNRLIVANSGWARDIPDWILKNIEFDRFTNEILDLLGKNTKLDYEKVSDSEVVAYLFTASLNAPLSHEFTQIYLYLSNKILTRTNRIVPDELKVKELSNYEQDLLKSLKYKIFKSRGKIEIPIIQTLKEVLKESKNERRFNSNG